MIQQWWGYRHTSGTYQTKPYREPLDIQEAKESPFCKIVVDPFDASSREDALVKVELLCDAVEEANCKGYELSDCCGAAIDSDTGICHDCKDHAENQCASCEGRFTCVNYKSIY